MPAQARREQPRDIGAEPEIGGVAQGHDAGVAQDQIEREREQDQDQDLGPEIGVIGKQEEGRDRERPGQGLDRPEAVARRDPAPGGRGRHRAQPRRLRASSPSGLASSRATVTT